MRKWKLKNAPLYLLFLVNCASAVKNGADWLFCVSVALTAAVFAADIWEVVKHGGEK